jgi:mRNA interferase RelE/StbE
MYSIEFEKRAVKFIQDIPLKHQKQIAEKIQQLKENPIPNDSKNLTGYAPYKRCDSGEYRVIYKIKENEKTVCIFLVGKRNDDAVYTIFKRLV